MFDFVHQFFENATIDSIFWFCALLGSGLFIIQFFGGDSHDDIDEGSGEIDTGKFKWLSKQALTGFFMMFGCIGLTCSKEFDFSGLSSSMISLVGGLFSIFITGFIFRGANKLRSSGTVFRIEDSIGKKAIIYQRIPRNGIGKISVSINNFTHEIDAISHVAEELPSFTSVQIIKKADDKTVFVIPIT